MYFNVNFNVLKQIYCALVRVIKRLDTLMFIQTFEVPETAVAFRPVFMSSSKCSTKLSGISNTLLSYFRRRSRGSTGNSP
jgi:hypothetical protein